MADDAKSDDQLATQTTAEADADSNLLTPQKHMDFIKASNERAEADAKAAEDAQREQAKALLKGDDTAKANVKAATRQDTTQGDKA